MTSSRLRLLSGVSLAALVLAGCGGGSGRPAPARATALSVTGAQYDVGGHELYVKCEGTGSPTVVYLHGLIVDSTSGGSQNSDRIPALLSDRTRVCIYDRANVGRSDAVAGPLTGADSVRDLHRLLAAAGVHGPYVLLGASFGGLIADMYAATYPREIAGMVLLDAPLPDDEATIDERFLPASARLKHADWKTVTERIDQLATFREAQAIERRAPRVPLTYIAAGRIELDPSWPVRRMSAAIRSGRRAFVARFSPGRLIRRDVPHFMEPVIPLEIADEVERVIAERPGR